MKIKFCIYQRCIKNKRPTVADPWCDGPRREKEQCEVCYVRLIFAPKDINYKKNMSRKFVIQKF